MTDSDLLYVYLCFICLIGCMAGCLAWATYKIANHLRRDRDKETELRLFDLMSSDDFKAYAMRLKEEHEARLAIASELEEEEDAEAPPEQETEPTPGNTGPKE